ncbi:DGQHR domain-containing protein [Myxococcus xanthus]|uniref:DGQHR domain-containing protein n=1 Tax=Myxococcus xanthus TaxID=34 RepID=UPI00112EEEFE|nr:DGQHR domain-containing protein [Myxococcus xanthus]
MTPRIEKRTFFGFRVRQRQDSDKSFFIFVDTAKDVLSWSFISRLEEQPGGIQRRLNDAKANAIARYFELNKDNTIPTSTTIAFKPKTTKFTKSPKQPTPKIAGVEWGSLSFQFNPTAPHHTRPAFVVDGQHRLHGMTRVEKEELPIPISALLDADSNEQAFHFVVINNKASKVPPNLVKSLIVDFDEENLNDRLRSARVSLGERASLVAVIDDDPESPFHEMVDWERRRGKGNPCIKPAAIEGSLSYARRRLPALDDDDDALIAVFFAIWSGTRDAYPKLWPQSNNNLFSNAGFRAYFEHIVDELDTLSASDFVNVSDASDVTATTKKIASQINSDFWTSDWQLKSLDTSSGRDILKNDLRQIRRNKKDKLTWSAGLDVLSAGT